MLQQRLPAQAYGRLLLRPDAQAPLALAPSGKQLCTCLDVSEPAITATLLGCTGNAAQRLGWLQGRLQCGTPCGSCIPELKRRVQHSAVPA